MKSNFLPFYHNECKRRYGEKGFVRTRQTYSRMENKILHTFTLKRHQFEPSCTIEFGIMPLCMEELYVDMGLYLLNRFDISTFQDGWLYDSKSEESVSNCISMMLDTVDRRLMPLFDRSNSYSTAFAQLVELDRLFERNRLAVVRSQGLLDQFPAVDDPIAMLPEKFYFALKCGDYSFAQKYLRLRISQYEKPSMHLENPYTKETERKLAELNRQLIMIDRGNISYFTRIFAENEKRNIENMYKPVSYRARQR